MWTRNIETSVKDKIIIYFLMTSHSLNWTKTFGNYDSNGAHGDDNKQTTAYEHDW